MQHVAAETFVPATAAGRRDYALSLYEAAAADPVGANWQTVAEALRSALPAAGRKPAAPKPDAGGVPAWWADYSIPRTYSLHSAEFTFADGVTVRCNVISAPRKPLRMAKACRVAVAFYRARTGRERVPEFARVQVIDGPAFDAATCSRLTADLRARVPAEPVRAPEPPAPAGETHLEWLGRIHGGTWRLDPNGNPYRVPGPAPVVAIPEPEPAAQPEPNFEPICQPDPVEAEGAIISAASNEAGDMGISHTAAEPEPPSDPVEKIDVHSVTAHCTSLDGVLSLRRTVRDGWSDAPQRKGIRWTCLISPADAERCEGIRGVKLAGRPRTAAPPREAIPPARKPDPAVRKPSLPCAALARSLGASVSPIALPPVAFVPPPFAGIGPQAPFAI